MKKGILFILIMSCCFSCFAITPHHHHHHRGELIYIGEKHCRYEIAMKDDEYVINEVFYTYYKYSECNHERSYQEERYFTKPTQEQIRTFKSLKPFQKYDPIRNRVEINGDCIAASILIMFLVVVVIFISLLISSVLL